MSPSPFTLHNIRVVLGLYVRIREVESALSGSAERRMVAVISHNLVSEDVGRDVPDTC